MEAVLRVGGWGGEGDCGCGGGGGEEEIIGKFRSEQKSQGRQITNLPDGSGEIPCLGYQC